MPYIPEGKIRELKPGRFFAWAERDASHILGLKCYGHSIGPFPTLAAAKEALAAEANERALQEAATEKEAHNA